jgi:hypothetical protein
VTTDRHKVWGANSIAIGGYATLKVVLSVHEFEPPVSRYREVHTK